MENDAAPDPAAGTTPLSPPTPVPAAPDPQPPAPPKPGDASGAAACGCDGRPQKPCNRAGAEEALHPEGCDGRPRQRCIREWNFDSWARSLKRTLVWIVGLYVGLHCFFAIWERGEWTWRGASTKTVLDASGRRVATATPAKVWRWAHPRTKWGYEYIQLDAAQTEHVNEEYRLYVASDSVPVDRAVNQHVLLWLETSFSDKLDTADLRRLRQYLNHPKTTGKLATDCLKNHRYRLRSFFWLTGPEVYLEIVFWSLLGVGCYLLYVLGYKRKEASKATPEAAAADGEADTFDPSHVDSMIARFFYAPACTLIVVLGYTYFRGESFADVPSSKGLIVLAFLMGFFATRMMSLLTRLKDALLPVDETGPTRPAAPAPAPKEAPDVPEVPPT